MSLQDLSLPIDIPWKLIATRRDMLASATNPFPNARWRSSVAIFAYDPDLSDLPEVFSDRELTFLKVVVSVTSYTPPQPDPKQYGENYAGLEAAQQAAGRSLPCCGALLQVAVYPRPNAQGQTPDPNTMDVTQLAIFTAIQPTKRELIEVVTESGEAMTQSKSDLQVRKGITSSKETEDRNITTAGLSISGEGGDSGGKASGSASITSQWGTINKSTVSQTNDTTTDPSRESGEKTYNR